MKEAIDGILLLDKPLGVSSNYVLQKTKYLLNALKAGHTGSLDPLASGMLPICFGKATKLSRFMLEADKSYEFTICLGVTTTTGDAEGEILSTKPVPSLTGNDLDSLVRHFQGTHQQIPPMYSALKYQGQPLYKLARAGKSVPRAPRTITISKLTLNSLHATHGNQLNFTTVCSKGTYIRTLAEEMGNYLGCGAHVQKLHRLYTSPFQSFSMIPLAALAALSLPERQAHLLPMPAVMEIFTERVTQLDKKIS